MGREYARLSGETETVAKGIYEHYLPRHGGDRLPETAEGALVSLADRIDTLAGCFAVGIQPSGSQDPYALRRQAQGAVAVLLERELDLTPRELVEEALSLLDPVVRWNPAAEERLERLLDFLCSGALYFQKGTAAGVGMRCWRAAGITGRVVPACLVPGAAAAFSRDESGNNRL